MPQLLARQPRAFGQRFQLRPHNRGMHPPVERALREAAIGARDHVLAPQEFRVTHNALGHQFGMLDDIRRVADDAGDQNLPVRQFHILPDFPFVLVARIGAFDQERADIRLHQNVHDVLQRHVGGVRPGPASPAHMIADGSAAMPSTAWFSTSI